jgi:hypothetical protein
MVQWFSPDHARSSLRRFFQLLVPLLHEALHAADSVKPIVSGSTKNRQSESYLANNAVVNLIVNLNLSVPIILLCLLSC